MAESLENSPSLYFGKPWSEWANKVEDNDELNRSKHGSGHTDSMRLKRDDMPLFGLCPAQDEFYVVVCEICSQVVKPQALLRHMEVRHGRRSRNYSPRRRKTSSTSSTALSPPREGKDWLSPSKSSKHDAHGKTPPTGDDVGGGTKHSGSDGSSMLSKHHHALSNTLDKPNKVQKNHSMPVVKMERLPTTMSAKKNAPTLHVPHSSNHKPAKPSEKPQKNNRDAAKEQRDKSKGWSLSHGSHRESHESKLNNSAKGCSSGSSKHESESKLGKDHIKSENCTGDVDVFSAPSEEIKHNDTNKRDLHSKSRSDQSPKKHSSSHSHLHHSSEGSKSGKHRHSHSGSKHSSSKHGDHNEWISGKQKHEKSSLDSSGISKTPDKRESSKHNGSKISSKSDSSKHNNKHDGISSKKHSSKESESTKLNSSKISDKEWNDITKLNSTKSSSQKDTSDFISIDSPERKPVLLFDDIKDCDSPPPLVSPKHNSQSQASCDTSQLSKHGLSGLKTVVEEKSSNGYKPPSLNLSSSSSSSESSSGLTSPTTPVLKSPDTPMSKSGSMPTTPILTSGTKHLDKIDINSPTSTFGKKLAALQNPGKLLPCKDREYNPDIHCGVISSEDGKPCTRSLTCKSHALSLRRAVPGRVKPFDELLLEHRAAKEAFLIGKREAQLTSAKGLTTKPQPSSKSSSLSAVPKIKSPPSSAAMASKASSMHSLTSEMTSPLPHPVKMSKSTTAAASSLHKVLPISVQLPPKPPQIAAIPASHPIPVPEPFVPSTLSDFEDDDDFRDRYEYPLISHYPRPAVANCFGARHTGSGCYVLNRKTDQLRAVFKLAVDRRLHPPPQKRLCLDSKLSSSSSFLSSSKDPYEFGTGSPYVSAKGNKTLKSHKSSPAGTAGSKSKAKEESGINYSAVLEQFDSSKRLNHTEGTGNQPDVFTTGQPTITTAASLISQSSSAKSTHLGGASGPPAKRKRSGSSPRPALATSNANVSSIGGFALTGSNNAISIAIPTGNLNLNLSSTTLNTLNATIAGNKLSHLTANKNNMVKDVNIMVTGGTPTVLNGQIVTSLPSSTLGDATQFQLKNNLTSPPPKSKSRKRTGSRSGSQCSGQETVSVVNTMASNAVVMDSSPNNLLPTASIAMVTTGTYGLISTPVTSPSPATTPSPIFATGPIPNGIVGQQGVKGVTSLNHISSGNFGQSPRSRDGTPSPSLAGVPLTETTPNTLEHHSSSQSKHSKRPSHKHLKGSHQHHTNQITPSLTSSFTSQPSHLLASSTIPYGLHGNTIGVQGNLSGTGYSHIQIQPKELGTGGSGKTVATGKLAMQPMTYTIPLAVAPGPLPEALTVMQGQGQQRALLIPTQTEPVERGHHHHHSHESISQSNLIS